MPSPKTWSMWHGKDEFHPSDSGETYGQRTMSFGQKDALRDGHVMSAGQSVFSLRTSAVTLGKSSLFSVIASYENDVSLEILAAMLPTTLEQFMRMNPKLRRAGPGRDTERTRQFTDGVI